MADYPTHAARAEELLAMLNPKSFTVKNSPDTRVRMAQVEAILALAAAVAGRNGQAAEGAWSPR
ncbi:hypothetical protein [Kitasatospora sp. NPDC096140]|uniref:hypothetical protein n=1 Tax=unclassified Kitasatospora TaxID=2633591 RepID=UPI0033179B72